MIYKTVAFALFLCSCWRSGYDLFDTNESNIYLDGGVDQLNTYTDALNDTRTEVQEASLHDTIMAINIPDGSGGSTMNGSGGSTMNGSGGSTMNGSGGSTSDSSDGSIHDVLVVDSTPDVFRDVVITDTTHDVVIDNETDGSSVHVIDISNPASFVLNGSSQIQSGELQVVPSERYVIGAAYLAQAYPINSTTSFTISFTFSIYNPTTISGDGFTFLWQNDARGTSALGSVGSGLGYEGITPSVAVEFDMFQNTTDTSDNDIAILSNGDVKNHIVHASPPFAIGDGSQHQVWITYDGVQKLLSVFVANDSEPKPSIPLIQTNIDVFAVVGSSAHIGFTAATGTYGAIHAIRSLTIN